MGIAWPFVVAFAIALPEAVLLVSALLQRSRIGGLVPAELVGIYDQDEYMTSNEYTKAKSDFGLVRGTFDTTIFFLFWFLKGFPWLDNVCVGFNFESPLLTGLAFLGALSFGHILLAVPWQVYGTFVLEERFGFNKTTPWTFMKDIFKTTVLGLVIGAPLMYGVLWFFTTMGPNAWLWVFLSTMFLQLVGAFLAPALILPLFIAMLPLPKGTALMIRQEIGNVALEFLSDRQLYMFESSFNGRQCWETRDRRFAGAKKGATLSIWWSLGKCQDHAMARETAESPAWVLAEGHPGGGGVIYATCASPEISMDTEWRLTPEALTCKECSGSRGPSDLIGPLVQEGVVQPAMLRVTCIDVGSLHGKITALAERLGYQGASIYVIDGSSRSGHSNAFCTGFGSFRRICLFDSLLPMMDEGEILAVLGHEIGHDRLYHVHTRLVMGIAEYFIMLFALGRFLESRAVSSAFFVYEPKVHLGLVLFTIVWSVVEFVVSIPTTMLTRMNEFSADRFSVEADETHGPLLASALKKLIRKSKVNLTPHPFTVFLTYSHPPLDARLQAIRDYHLYLYGGGAGGCRELRLQQVSEP